MAQTIEDVNGRTLLQQFHGLYKKQQEQQATIEQNANEIATKQNALTAGENITIDNNTISSVPPQNMMTTDTQQDFTYPKKYKKSGLDGETLTFGGMLNGNSITGKDESHPYEKTYVFKGGDEMLKVENVETEEHAESTYQKKLTAGTNITIDSNNVISASGGLQEVKANNVNSETATQGQVLMADGSGGASWQNASCGDKWYQHNITISPYSTQICILLKSNTLFTLNSLSEWLWTNNYKQTTPYTVNYPRIWDDTIAIGYGLYAPTSTNAYIRVAKIKVNSTISDNVITNTYSVAYDFIPVSSAHIIDTVTEL